MGTMSEITRREGQDVVFSNKKMSNMDVMCDQHDVVRPFYVTYEF